MNLLYSAQHIEILLVESSPSDANLILETLNDAKVCNRLHIVEDGVEALAFLSQQEPYIDAPRPDLILLNLNLPKKNGREVLAEMQANPSWRSIPIVVMVTSAVEEASLRATHMSATCFVAKPLGLGDFIQIMRLIEVSWLVVVPASAVS